VQNRLRELEQRGLIAVVESANGKRYGRCNPKGYIIEEFGFDLSPLAARREEFFQIIEQGQAERAERDSLRRSITIKRKAIAQIAHSALDSGYDGADWTNMIRIAAAAAAPAAYSNQILHLRDILAVLRNLHDEAEKAWRVALEAVQLANDLSSDDVDTASEGAANCTHIQLQKNLPSFKKDIGSAKPLARQKNSRTSGDRPALEHTYSKCGTIDDHMKRYRLNPGLISELFPELGLNNSGNSLKWADIHDAASVLASCLGISHHAWSDACRIIGRNGASISVALIAAKNDEIRSPGGYLRKMAARAETDDLHLGPSVFAIRDKRNISGSAPVGGRIVR
jgi:replication initiation protein RepC